MSTMRLSIFAYHASQIMGGEPGKEFTLHPCEGVAVKVWIEKNPEQPHIWDTVYINGKSAGNRHGGVSEFIAIVLAAKPEIEYS